MFHQLLQRLKLGPGGDVITTVVKLANLVVFDVVSLHLVPVPDRQRVGTFSKKNALAPSSPSFAEQTDTSEHFTGCRT